MKPISNKHSNWIQVLVMVVFGMCMIANQPAAGDTLTLVVTNAAGGYAPGSLLEIVHEAQYAFGYSGANILFSNVTGTISLNSQLVVAGQSVFVTNVNILGPGAQHLAITGPGQVFNIKSGSMVAISGLTIGNGNLSVGEVWPSNQIDPAECGGGIMNNGNLTLADCIITNNHFQMQGSHASSGIGSGGGIANFGTLAMSNCIICRNACVTGYPDPVWENGTAGGDGGGLFNSGIANLIDCTINNNSAGYGGFGVALGCYGGRGGNGGGICNYNGVLSLTRCTLSGNTCGGGGNGGAGQMSYYPTGGAGGVGGRGGAIYNLGTLLLTNCTINGNATGSGGVGGAGAWGTTPPYYTGGNGGNGGDGGNGGGICNAGGLTLFSCTVSGNTTAQGGNRGVGGTSGTVVNPTNGLPGLAGNPGNGGGIYGAGTFFNSIVAQNAATGSGPDVSGGFTSLGYNLIGNTSGGSGFGVNGDILNVDPLLGPLADNGGLTYTMALLPGSPAVDKGNAGGDFTDQRGRVRPYDSVGILNASDGSDIGAYEVIGTLPVPMLAWGLNGNGQAQVRLDAIEVIAIAAGVYHSLALRSDGTVVGWGENDFGQTTPPAGLSNVIAIAAGWGTSLALKRDGTLAQWGWDGGYGLKATAESLTNITAISACWDCLMALKRDGTVFIWGKSTHDETNVPAGLNNVTAIAGGGVHCLALKSDGTAVAWGDNSEGQLNIPAGLSGVVGIAGGGYHSMALRQDGAVVVWGKNAAGQTNVPTDLAGVVAISGGTAHSLALKSDGHIAAWGDNSSGQTNVPASLTNVVAIAAGGYHNLALTGSRAPWTKFNHICSTTNGQVHFTVAGLCGDVYQIMASTNLTDWQCLSTVTNITGTSDFTDTESSTYNQRFYRIFMP